MYVTATSFNLYSLQALSTFSACSLQYFPVKLFPSQPEHQLKSLIHVPQFKHLNNTRNSFPAGTFALLHAYSNFLYKTFFSPPRQIGEAFIKLECLFTAVVIDVLPSVIVVAGRGCGRDRKGQRQRERGGEETSPGWNPICHSHLVFLIKLDC